jgi:L-aspartate oxidase
MKLDGRCHCGDITFEAEVDPDALFGQGLVLAARAGAVLVDMEFVQFHPTSLDTDASPLTLVSEAVRGEGATLVDETGTRFIEMTPGKELAPRDVVARALWRHMSEGHRVFLDARHALGSNFARHFPVIAASCAIACLTVVRADIVCGRRRTVRF